MNRICFVALLLFIQNLSFSQEIEWQNTIGGSFNDQLFETHQTSDGGYICGGCSNSQVSGDKTEFCNGGWTDYWVIKLDSIGNIEWQNTIGGINVDRLYSISQTADGGYICGGSSESEMSFDKTENSNGGFDIWVIKLDMTGNIQWQNTIGGASTESLNSIKQTNDGGYICGGTSASDISGDKSENSQGFFDYWIIKLDSLGNIIWQNTIGGSLEETLNSINQTLDGGYICGGISSSGISGDKSEINQGLTDYWVVKLDSIGNIQWQNTIGGNNHDKLTSIEQTTDGSYICGGYSDSNITGDKDEDTNGYSDYWVIRLDSIGNILWQNSIGGMYPDNLNSISQTTDGGFICSGSSGSPVSGDKTENSNGGADYWVIKLDSAGNIEWQNSIGGSLADYSYSIEQTSDGGLICSGYSSSDLSADKSEDAWGISSNDYWIVKLKANYNLIQGKGFIDSNSNSIFDSNENALMNSLITEGNTGRLAACEQNGSYSLSILDFGNYSVYPSTVPVYYSVVPVSHSAFFSSVQQVDSLNDFAFQPIGSINDLMVTLTPTSVFRVGFDAYYHLHYKNVGTTSLSGTVIFYPDTGITFVSSLVAPFFVSADSVMWQTPVLLPFDEGDIYITVNVNTTTLSGTMVNSCAKIEPITGDAEPVNNQNCWEVVVTASSDPNDILVSRDTIPFSELNTHPYLDYIIRFQNTGTDTAFNIWINNNITEMLDLATFQLIASSHPVSVTYENHNRLFTFSFDNILLPDSNVNEPLSHGFVRYRINPLATLLAGDSVKNKAFIYFDFNAPVETNTAVTEIVMHTTIPFHDDDIGFSLYPNPTKNNFTVSIMLKEDAVIELQLYNAIGQVVNTILEKLPSGKNELPVFVQALPKGVYYLKVSVGGNSAVRKLVKL